MRAMNTTLLLLACAWPMAAQETGKPPMHEKDKPMTDTMAHQDKRMVVKGETVFGADIRSGGEDIGDIKDLIVDRDGQITYVVLGIDKGDDRLVALPWKAMQIAISKDDPDDYEFAVVVDKARLATAPTFKNDKWPNLASADWARETDEFFRDVDDMGRGARPAGTPTDEGAGARPAGMAKALAFRGKKLQGCQVDTSEGKNAGEIENLAIDAKSGRIAFVVLSTGGFLGLGEDHHAIPMQAFTFTREDDDDLTCKLNIPESKLEGAPKFDKSDWDAADDVVFVEKIYSHYGYPPYWSDRPMGGTEVPVKKPGEDEGDDR
jgi:sporulation protein YlmC with PRC-barrel domain